PDVCASDLFVTAVRPASASRIGNVHYKGGEELLYACAEAMREEYKAILDAGLVLQLDDPAIAESWDMIDPEPSVEDYRKFTMVRVEALNHALRGLPQERIRFHLCWGSWHGPHTTDIPMRDIVQVMLAVNAGAYSFEAGNVRHEHEWRVWQDVKLPDDKVILPGVVSHATNVVEHPELVAERIARFADLVGRGQFAAYGEEDGSGSTGSRCCRLFGHTTFALSSMYWMMTGNARSFWPAMAPSPRNFTPKPSMVPPSGMSTSSAALRRASGSM